MLFARLTPARLALGVVLLLLLLVPVVGGRYETYLVTQILIFALFALALNLMVGSAGLVSFGHAAYFAIGAYAVAVLGTTLAWPFALTFGGAIVLSALAALVIGYFCVRLTSIYLAMLTLAFAQLVWAVAFQWRSVTRGDTGFIGLRVPDLISSPQAFYYFALLTVVLSALVLWLVRESAFGRTLVSARENAVRTEFVGVNVKRIQLVAFVVSGTFSGVAGALFALFNRSVFPEFAWWTMSAEVLIMTILGGIYSFFGPALGAAAIILLDVTISEHTEYWPTVLGLILLVVLFVFPDGLAGLAGRWRRDRPATSARPERPATPTRDSEPRTVPVHAGGDASGEPFHRDSTRDEVPR
jgi:branched-chain amino acid transport system permease protein